MREKGLKMEFASKNVHTKQKQFDAMVEFMCLHPDLAKGHLRTPDAKQTSNNLWKRLASELNADGPPMREADAWKKVWADHKAYIKSKLRKNKVSISGTGGGPSKHCSFTPSEELVINLLNIDESISGISSARVFGVQIDNCERAPTEVSEPVSSEVQHVAESEGRRTANVSSNSAKRSTTRNKENLLQKQVDNQIEYHKKSYSMFKEMNENLKTLAKYEKKKYDLKEKKYKLAKDKFEHKKRNDYEKNKIKLSKLELKKEIWLLQNNNNSQLSE